MTLSSLNFNSHPELTDEQFAIAAMNVYFGTPPTQSSVDQAVTTIVTNGGGAAGRYSVIWGTGSGSANGWLAQGIQGNADDNWFRNIPTWFWIAFVPIIGIVAVIAAWKAWGHLAKDAMKESGSSNGSAGY